jgi:hypothetical protein
MKTILFCDILKEIFETVVDEYPLHREMQLDWADVVRTKYISESTDCMESVRDLIYYRVIVVWSPHKLVTAKTLITGQRGDRGHRVHRASHS